MQTSPPNDLRSRLLPEGRRWGLGTHSLVPYLKLALEARPGDDSHPVESIRNPVFAQMEQALQALHQRH